MLESLLSHLSGNVPPPFRSPYPFLYPCHEVDKNRIQLGFHLLAKNRHTDASHILKERRVHKDKPVSGVFSETDKKKLHLLRRIERRLLGRMQPTAEREVLPSPAVRYYRATHTMHWTDMKINSFFRTVSLSTIHMNRYTMDRNTALRKISI